MFCFGLDFFWLCNRRKFNKSSTEPFVSLPFSLHAFYWPREHQTCNNFAYSSFLSNHLLAKGREEEFLDAFQISFEPRRMDLDSFNALLYIPLCRVFIPLKEALDFFGHVQRDKVLGAAPNESRHQRAGLVAGQEQVKVVLVEGPCHVPSLGVGCDGGDDGAGILGADGFADGKAQNLKS